MSRAALSLICAAGLTAGGGWAGQGAWAKGGAPVPTSPEVRARAAAERPPEPGVFAAWIAAFKERARAAGIGEETLDAAFRKVRYNAQVIAYDNHQPEFVKPVGVYVDARTKPATVAKGRALSATHKALFDKVEKAYGVPRHYILAIWRLESGYGAQFGGFNVIEALATLAFRGRRKGFWADELLAALKIVDRGDVKPDELRGSWAGAMGHTQFIPSTYLRSAVDFDGDGRRDLWKSLADAFGSTANYLKSAGWTPGLPFGVEVKLPAGFDYATAHAGTKLPVEAWRNAGVTLIDGRPLPAFPGDTSVIVPTGHKGPVFLVTANYRALLRYNNAAAYALTVGILAERIAGRGAVARPWPNDDRLLDRDEKEELQRLLAGLGFDPGPVDGKVGPSTRAAIRAFQQKVGQPADGYANYALLQLIRSRPVKKSAKESE